jgi:hypothetical protein
LNVVYRDEDVCLGRQRPDDAENSRGHRSRSSRYTLCSFKQQCYCDGTSLGAGEDLEDPRYMGVEQVSQAGERELRLRRTRAAREYDVGSRARVLHGRLP